MGALCQPPDIDWADREGPVQSLYYTGEPYRGRPTRVFAYYAAPEVPEGRVPAMVLVHGGGGKAFPEWAELWAERGYAALAMDLSGRGPDGERLPDGGPEQGEKEKFFTLPDGITETWPYYAVAAVVRGVSLLAAQPEVDPDRLGITGISWGGYLTCIVSGLDDRLKVSIPVYGCGFLHHNSAWVPTLEKLSEEEREAWLSNFDPSAHLPNARMPMLWVNGTNDLAYPLDSYQKSYRLPPGPRTLCVTVRMPHGHDPGWAPVEIGLFADQHLRGGTPLPEVQNVQLEGDRLQAEFRSSTNVVESAFHWTPDTVTWNERTWHSWPATIADGRAAANVPRERPIAFFLTITDERGATVSTEHQVLTADGPR